LRPIAMQERVCNDEIRRKAGARNTARPNDGIGPAAATQADTS
jgi:hypothetical protein